jgi:hypothetical protein
VRTTREKTAAASTIVALLVGCQGVVPLATKPDAGALPWCQTQLDDDRGHILACNDFEQVSGPEFGLPPSTNNGNIALSLDPFASSPSQSLRMTVAAAPRDKPLLFAAYDYQLAENLSLALDLSFGADSETPTQQQTQSPVTLAGFQFENSAVAAFAVQDGHVAMGYVANLGTIAFSDLIAQGQVINAISVGHDFTSLEFRMRRGLTCGTTKAIGPEPSADGPDALYVAIYIGGLLTVCSRLPVTAPGMKAAAVIGGFLSRRDEPIVWRIDNVVVRALP